MQNFKQNVIEIVKQIPYGKVASYGDIAVYADTPRAARQVGWILNKLPENSDVPWWRVVNNVGRISIKDSEYSALDQKELLISEGIDVRDDFTFDIKRYRWHPKFN